MKSLSIVIVSYNTKKLILKCIDSIYKFNKKLNIEIIVVDNDSSDGSTEELSKNYSQKNNFVLVKSHENIGFAAANNIGISKAKGKYVLLLNSDTLTKSDFLNEMIDWMDAEKEVGIASCALKNADGTIQATGGYFPNLVNVATWMTIQDLPFVDSLVKPFHPLREKFNKNSGFYSQKRELDWVTGAFMLIRKSALNDIKGFDEDYFMYTEDVDLCYRTRKKGWKIVYNPKWYIVHFGGASSTKEFSVLSEFKGIKTFFKKHHPLWQLFLVRFFLKIGAFWRMFVLGIIEGPNSFKVYAKAFIKA